MPVLNDLFQKDVLGGRRLDPAWKLRDRRVLCGCVAALARDDAVAVDLSDIPDGDRLQDTESPDGLREFVQVPRIDFLPWLIRVWLDPGDVDEERPGQLASPDDGSRLRGYGVIQPQ